MGKDCIERALTLLVALALIGLLPISKINAQDLPLLTLDECIQKGLKNDRNLVQSEEDLKKAKNNIWSSYANFLPYISLDFDYYKSSDFISYDFVEVYDEEGDSMIVQQLFIDQKYGTSLRISQNLFSGFSDYFGLKASKSAEKSTQKWYENQILATVYNLKVSYFDVLKSMKLADVQKKALERSDEQLRMAMEQQGVNFEEFKQQMEETYLRENVIYAEVRANIVVDDSETVGYYNEHREQFTEPPEYRIRAIYLSSDQNDEEEIQEKKEEIDKRRVAGEDMASLAGEYSEGPERESQGDLGSFKKGELASDLEKVVESLEPGDTSPWIQMGNGWYLIRLEEQKASRLKAYEEVRKEIENMLYEERSQKKLREYIEELKKRSYIKILIPNPSEYKGSFSLR